ncbi:MAG: cytochrome c maturation protein CcmE [Pseudomonadota bacterium]
MTRKQKRLAGIATIGTVLAISLLLASVALRDEIVFFFDPTDVVVGGKVKPGERFRIGGLVADGSLDKTDTVVSFVVTDGQNSVSVEYEGILPDLFREGQGVIAEGMLKAEGEFVADTVLAKHDETYIPKELEGMMKEKGVWKGKETQ